MAGPVAGKISTLKVGVTSPATTDVKGRVDFNFNLDKTEIDAGHMDITNGWSAFLQGRKNATISGTVRYIEEDAGQIILLTNAFADGDTIYVAFTFAAGGDSYTAQGFVTNINPSPADEDVTNMSFTIRLTGAVAK